jgi:outer membrane lipoprotein-sorting protein
VNSGKPLKTLVTAAFCLVIAAHGVFASDAKPALPAQLADSDAAASPEDKIKITLRIKTLQSGIDAVSARVYQTKHLSLLKKAIESEGTVTIRKTPRRLIWEILKPERTITAIDDNTITIYKPIEKEADIYDIESNIAAKQSMAFFSSSMWGDLSEMEKRFKVDIYIKKGIIIYKLAPISEMIMRYLTSIVIYFDETTGIPAGFELTTPKGDRHITSLRDVKTNPRLGTDTFNLRLPKDVWIRDHTKPDENTR